MKRYLSLVKRGIERPSLVAPYLVGTLFPDSKWGPSVEVQEDFITFREGGFVYGVSTRPEFCARLYRDVQTLRVVVDAVTSGDVDMALDVGCGYGRLTPWLGEFASDVHGVDPNEDVLANARTLFPTVAFRADLAQDLSYADDTFDLVVSWSTLQHVPPADCESVAAELQRVLAPGGVLIVHEQSRHLGRRNAWGRTKEEYERLFSALELIDVRRKPVEPTFDGLEPPIRDDSTEQTYHPFVQLLSFSDVSNRE